MSSDIRYIIDPAYCVKCGRVYRESDPGATTDFCVECARQTIAEYNEIFKIHGAEPIAAL